MSLKIGDFSLNFAFLDDFFSEKKYFHWLKCIKGQVLHFPPECRRVLDYIYLLCLLACTDIF